MRWALLLLLTALTATIASAETVLEDPQGDVTLLVAEEVPATGLPSEPADLWSLAIEETEEHILFVVESAGRGTETAGQTWDAARLDVRFRHGDNWFDVGTGIEISGQEFAELRMREGNSAERIVGALDLETDGAGLFTVQVPREWLRDHNGAPPMRGALFEDIHMDAHAHSTGLFLVNPDGTLFQPVGIRDRMPDTGSAVYEVQTGGPSVTGELQIDIPLPYRASNGGATLIAYEALFTHPGATYGIELLAANPEWTVTYPETLAVETNTSFQVFIETPDKHLHGGVEELTFRATDLEDPGNQGTFTFGLLYLEIPQPAGHHPTIYLHSRSTPQPIAGQFGGGSNGIFTFNTEEEDPADEGIGITAGGPGSVAGAWNICLDPELRLGLQANASKTGELELSFQGGGPGTATLEWFLAPTQDCAAGQNRETLTTTGVTGSFDETHVFPIPPTSFREPYERGQTVGFRVEIIYDQPQTQYTTLLGGYGTLPLDEFYDERPAGLIGDAVVEAAPEPQNAPEEVEETPMLPLALVGGGLLLAARRRF